MIISKAKKAPRQKVWQRKLSRIAVVLLVVVGLSAIEAGFSFMMEPSGAGLGIPTEYLRFSPFHDFLIPGIILFHAIGVLSIVAAGSILRKSKNYHWLIMLQGVLLGGWIVVQVMMVQDFNALHISCLLIALALLYIGYQVKQLDNQP